MSSELKFIILDPEHRSTYTSKFPSAVPIFIILGVLLLIIPIVATCMYVRARKRRALTTRQQRSLRPLMLSREPSHCAAATHEHDIELKVLPRSPPPPSIPDKTVSMLGYPQRPKPVVTRINTQVNTTPDVWTEFNGSNIDGRYPKIGSFRSLVGTDSGKSVVRPTDMV